MNDKIPDIFLPPEEGHAAPSIDIEQYKGASRFLVELREAVAEHDKGFQGKNKKLSPNVADIIERVAENSHMILATGIDGEVTYALEKRLEEVAGRVRMLIPAEFREAVYKLVGLELMLNCDFYGIKNPKQGIAATVFNGYLGDEVNVKKFPFFEDSKWVIKHVVINNPKDPKGFLENAIKEYDKLVADPEIGDFFKDSKWVIKHVVINNPKDPKGFLENAIKEYDKLVADPEIGDFFKDSKSAIKRAVISYEDPKGFLEDAIGKIKKMAEKYKDTKITRRDIIDWAIMYPEETEKYLADLLVERLTGKAPKEGGVTPD